jgi:hypothetical protein
VITAETVLTEIMRLLSTNKGVALVILVIAITITALIGAGITSFMASKKASEELPLYSYQAYLLAHAGVEFAIRYVRDNKDGFKNNPNSYIFAYDATNQCTATALDTTNHWKQINLPSGFTKDDRGTLYVSLEGNCLSSCVLHSCGKYGAAVREIRLHNFRYYY